MDFNAIIKRVIALVTSPKTEWEKIKNEPMTTADMFIKYAIILAAIPAIAGFIGYSVIGISFGFGTVRVPVGTSLVWAILTYILSLAGVFVMALIIDALAPSFGAQKDMNRSLKVVLFSYTATWVAGILYIIPSLAILVGLVSLYTLYLLYVGMEILKEPPKEKLMGYFVVSLVVAIVVYFVIGLIVSRVAFGSLYTAGLFR